MQRQLFEKMLWSYYIYVDIQLPFEDNHDANVAPQWKLVWQPWTQAKLPEIESLECVLMLSFVSVSEQKYAELKECTEAELNYLQETVQHGWPERTWRGRAASCSAILGLQKSAGVEGLHHLAREHAEAHAPITTGNGTMKTESM